MMAPDHDRRNLFKRDETRVGILRWANRSRKHENEVEKTHFHLQWVLQSQVPWMNASSPKKTNFWEQLVGVTSRIPDLVFMSEDVPLVAHLNSKNLLEWMQLERTKECRSKTVSRKSVVVRDRDFMIRVHDCVYLRKTGDGEDVMHEDPVGSRKWNHGTKLLQREEITRPICCKNVTLTSRSSQWFLSMVMLLQVKYRGHKSSRWQTIFDI